MCRSQALSVWPLADRGLGQADILHHGPHDGQATRFCGESVNLIGPLPNVTQQAFNGIGTANGAMHDLREGIKRQHMLFILDQAADGFGRALLVLGLEGRQIQQSMLPVLLFPDACQRCGDLLLLALGDGIHDIALFVDEATLPRGRRKQGGHRCQQPVMSIGHQQIDLAHPACAQILSETTPAVFVFFRTSTESQHFSAALQVHSERRYNHRRIRFGAMAHREMDQRPA